MPGLWRRGQLSLIDEGDAKAGYLVRDQTLPQGSSWRHQAPFKNLYGSFEIRHLVLLWISSIVHQSTWRKASTLGRLSSNA
jgi:hypothetical protein